MATKNVKKLQPVSNNDMQLISKIGEIKAAMAKINTTLNTTLIKHAASKGVFVMCW